jgi:hypothetical protein
MAPPDNFDRLLDVAQVLALGLLMWGVRVLMQTRDDVRDIKHTLFGPQGQNGLRGDVSELQASATHADTRTTRLADGLNETRRHVKMPEVDYLRGT